MGKTFPIVSVAGFSSGLGAMLSAINIAESDAFYAAVYAVFSTILLVIALFSEAG